MLLLLHPLRSHWKRAFSSRSLLLTRTCGWPGAARRVELYAGFISMCRLGFDQHGLLKRSCRPELLSGAFGLDASLIAIVIATAAGVALVVLAVTRPCCAAVVGGPRQKGSIPPREFPPV